MKKIIFLIAVSQMLVMCIIFRKSTAEWKNLELYWNEKERENKNINVPTMEKYSGSNIILNDEDIVELALYFKNDMELINSEIGSSISKNKKNSIKFFDKTDEYYSLLPQNEIDHIEKPEFLYGKIMKVYLNYYKLELFEIDSNYKINKKVKYKYLDEDEEINKILENINSSKLEGYYNLGDNNSVVTIITKNKKIYKSLKMLTSKEKQLYDKMMKLFENDIPKNYFEKRFD